TMDSTQRQVVDRLARAHASMTRMIASLLDIARADSDVLATRIEAVSLATLLAEVVEEIGPAAAERAWPCASAAASRWWWPPTANCCAAS
ncbi:MAG: hypothetical protein ACM31L_09165, partial [Actinomycetota bacterium]